MANRQMDGPPWKRYLRRSLRVVAGLLAVAEILFPIVESYIITNTSVRSDPVANLGAEYEEI